MDKDNENILILIQSQHENFKTISSLIERLNITSGNLFLPQMISNVSSFIENDINLYLEAISYLDMVNLFSCNLYGNHEKFVNDIISNIITNRTVMETKDVLGISNISDLIVKKENFNDFLIDNKIFIVLYIFSLLETIFFNKQN